MSVDGYYREKFASAVSCLVSLSDIRTRVLHALVSLSTVHPGKFTNPALGEQFAALIDELTRNDEEVPGEGKYQATLRNMSDDAVADVSQRILAIHNGLLRDLAPDL